MNHSSNPDSSEKTPEAKFSDQILGSMEDLRVEVEYLESQAGDRGLKTMHDPKNPSDMANKEKRKDFTNAVVGSLAHTYKEMGHTNLVRLKVFKKEMSDYLIQAGLHRHLAPLYNEILKALEEDREAAHKVFKMLNEIYVLITSRVSEKFDNPQYSGPSPEIDEVGGVVKKAVGMQLDPEILRTLRGGGVRPFMAGKRMAEKGTGERPQTRERKFPNEERPSL